MKTIYKYSLGIPAMTPEHTIIYTEDARIIKPLTVQMQGDYAVLWAEVELERNVTHRYSIWNIWTGIILPEDMENSIYLNTIQEPNTGLVYHYYIKEEK